MPSCRYFLCWNAWRPSAARTAARRIRQGSGAARLSRRQMPAEEPGQPVTSTGSKCNAAKLHILLQSVRTGRAAGNKSVIFYRSVGVHQLRRQRRRGSAQADQEPGPGIEDQGRTMQAPERARPSKGRDRMGERREAQPMHPESSGPGRKALAERP